MARRPPAGRPAHRSRFVCVRGGGVGGFGDGDGGEGEAAGLEFLGEVPGEGLGGGAVREVVDAEVVAFEGGGDVALDGGGVAAEEGVVAGGDDFLLEDGFEGLEVHDHVGGLVGEGRGVFEGDGDAVGVAVEVAALAGVAGEEVGGVEGAR